MNILLSVFLAACAVRAEGPESRALELAKRYETTQALVLELRRDRLGWGEIEQALSLARRARRPVTEIVALRRDGQGWGEIANRYGVDVIEPPRRWLTARR